LCTDRLPVPLHLAYASVLRFRARVGGYWFMLTPAYPGGLYGDQPETLTWADGPQPDMAPGYGAPGPAYGTPAPGYGGPVDAPPPGYGGPGYGGPGYGGPGYGTPGYGTPGYGDPRYGAPAGFGAPGGYGTPDGYGTPGGYPAGLASHRGMWLLTLTKSASRLLTVFLVLGVLFYVGDLAVTVVRVSSTVSTVAGLNRVIDSANTLTDELNSPDTATTSCGQNLTCLTRQDATLAAGFNSFSSQLSGASLPGNTTADKNKLSADTLVVAHDFTKLSQATTPDQYNSTLSSIGLQAALDTWSTDVTTLSNDA
jgi:hypothetical protein